MTQQIRIGKVLLTKGGKWNAETLYPQLTFVIHNNDGWWAAHANIGSEPSADNHNWVQATDVRSLIEQVTTTLGSLDDFFKAVQAAEAIRVEAEIGRVTAEAKRTEDEETRKASEAQRIENEAARQASETQREEAEALRASAEDARVHEFDSLRAGIGSELELVKKAVDNADIKAQAAQSAADTALSAAATATKVAENVNDAVDAAEAAATLANEKAALADTKASAAHEAATLANEKAGIAQTAADNANEKAALAQSAADSVDAAKTAALEAATHANEKATLAEEAASLAIEKASAAETSAALANEKAGVAQEAASLATEKAGVAQAAADSVDAAKAAALAAADNANAKAEVAQTAADNADAKAKAAEDAASLAIARASDAQTAAETANTAAANTNAIIDTANDKIAAAEEAAALANEKAALADTKASAAQEAASLATEKAGMAQTAADNATEKATLAQAAADNANAKAEVAQTAADNSNEKAEVAQTAADNANTKATLAQEAASLATDKASAAETAAALATEKAGVAQTAADNANTKAEVAQTAANNANDKAALAQSAANSVDESKTAALEAAALANEKAGVAQAAADSVDAAIAKVNNFETRLGNVETGKQDDVTKLDEATEVDYLIGVQGGAAKKISADNISIETELHGMAWGIILNPNSANAELSVVGNYALWTEFKESIGRYQMNNSGKAIKLHPLDSSKYIDGTDIDTSKGHIMVHVPDLYYKVVEQSNGNSILWMSARPIGGHAIHTSGEGNGSWIGAYIGREVDGALVSKPSLNPTRSKDISSFFATAQVNGPDFGLSDYEHRQLMMMLYLSEYHNENSQACLGYGMNGNANNWVAGVQNALTGETASLGDGCGSVAFHSDDEATANACHISLFGIEDPYGWYWEMIQGCYFGNSGNEAQTGSEMFVYKGNRMPTSDELTTQPSGAFRQLTRTTSSGNVYALQMGDHFDVLPGKLGSGGWSDYHWANTTGQLLLWGGHAYDGSKCGLAYSDSDYAFSFAYSDFAARLAYYGVATVVSRPTEL